MPLQNDQRPRRTRQVSNGWRESRG